ncbi:MAG: hypothetical protein EPN91_05750 [Salinibacterium sp.]|nr:MAG: hypothetical protein EPN91_05750 [Salinibacterium sp.]
MALLTDSEDDMKSSQQATRDLIAVVTELAEIVRDLDPGRTRQYALIEQLLERARGHLIAAESYERS